MAKKKEVKLVECKDCYSNYKGHCTLKIKHKDNITEYSKCKDKPLECIWWKKAKNEN